MTKYYIGQKLRFQEWTYSSKAATFERTVTVAGFHRGHGSNIDISMKWTYLDGRTTEVTWSRDSVDEEMEPVNSLEDYVNAKLRANGYLE